MNKIIISLLTFFPMIASAQNADDYGFGTNDAIQEANLGDADLKETIVNIINIVLGFLGILSVLIILLGGFKWMVSQGNTEKVDEAKKLIGAGVIGLVIIITSFAIANFVVTQLLDATNAGTA